jgi:hypothetical protein
VERDYVRQFTDVDCSPTAQCVAVDVQGDVYELDSSESSWELKGYSDLYSARAIDCSGTTCLINGSLAAKSIDLDTFQTYATWNYVAHDPECISIDVCYMIRKDQLLINSNVRNGGSTWEAQAAPGVRAISCPNSGSCFLATEDGMVSHSSNPSAEGWGEPFKVSADGLTDLSCPSGDECVAVTGTGKVTESHSPAQGPESWSAPGRILGTGSIAIGVSCAPSGLCSTWNLRGEVASSIETPEGDRSWNYPSPVGQFGGIGSIACSNVLCYAADRAGGVTTGG